MSEKPLRVRYNRSGATEGCSECPHNGEHDEIMPPPGIVISHRPPILCSEGGKVRCIPVKREEE